MRKILGKEEGVSVGTQPLSLIMEEKMNDKLVPTAVLTMEGNLKNCLDDQDQEALLSSPDEEVLSGAFPCLLGHPESWSSAKVKQTKQPLLMAFFSLLSFSHFYFPTRRGCPRALKFYILF